MDGPLATAYGEASGFFVEVTSQIGDDDWSAPGLGQWTVRDLVGHANRAHTLIEEHLLRPQSPEASDSPYFRAGAIAARGREAAIALGPDALLTVKASSAQAVRLVTTTPPGATIGSPVATMTLAEYLPSRIAELTIHTIDLELAIGVETPVPWSALEESLSFVALRSSKTDGVLVLRSLTGRSILPTNFFVY
jgi:uncharacterized protein (TIGR03083 family)